MLVGPGFPRRNTAGALGPSRSAQSAAGSASVSERHRLIVLLAILLIALAVGAATVSAATPDPKARALVLLADIVRGRDAAVTATFVPALRRQLPPAVLKAEWKTFQQALGRYRGHGRPASVTFGPQTVVGVPLRMARHPGQLRVTILRNGKVTAISFVRPGLPL